MSKTGLVEQAKPNLVGSGCTNNMTATKPVGALAVGVTAGIGIGYLLAHQKFSSNNNEKKNTRATTSSDNLDEIEQLIRPNILELTPYRCARDDYDQGILLDANENSLGPPFEADNTLRNEQLERYPCPYQKDVKTLLANYRCVVKNQTSLPRTKY